MPNRNQPQDQPGRNRTGNPATTSPDDDEAQEADVTRAGNEQQPGEDRRRRAVSDVEQVEDEQADNDDDTDDLDDDEDEDDNVGPTS
jgi:hypothetical protein